MATYRSDMDAHEVQLACFCVGEQEYALDIMRIKEIINPVPIVPVPFAPAYIEGVIELRGAFLGVIDLGKRFGLGQRELRREAKYVVVLLGDQYVGLIVDRVIEVRRVRVADIRKAPPLLDVPGTRYVAGVAGWEGRVALVLRLDELLSPEERVALVDAGPHLVGRAGTPGKP